MTAASLTRLMRHGGSAAAWLARDHAARQQLQRAAADPGGLAGAADWAALLQTPLAAAEPAVQTLLDGAARGTTEAAEAQQRGAGRRLSSGAPPRSQPDPVAQVPGRTVAAPPPAVQQAQMASPATAPAGATPHAGTTMAPRAAAGLHGSVAPARPRRSGAAGAAGAAGESDAAARALAQWQRRAADAGLAEAFDSVVGAGSRAGSRAGSGVGSMTAAVLAPTPALAASPLAGTAPPSPADRVDDVLGRIASGVRTPARTVAAVGAVPGSAMFQPAPRPGGGIAPAIADALAGAASAAAPRLPSRGGFRGLAELAARAAAGAAAPVVAPSPAQPAPALVAGAAGAAGADRDAALDGRLDSDRDDDLAARIARILRRAAERDGVDLDDVQPG